jgi:RND family efflux transporter MFP subunit
MKTGNLFLLLGWFGLVSCSKDDTATKPGETAAVSEQVTLGKATKAEVPVYEEVVGTVHPRLRAAVSAKILGKILVMKAVPGKAVDAGEELAMLDAAELEASRDRAKAAMEQAARDLARYRELVEANAITQAEFDRVESVYTMAAAASREGDAALANARVLAPFAGVVTRKLAEEGDMARPGLPLFEIESPGTLRLEMNVGESLAGTLSLGQEIPVVIEAAEARLLGKVAEIAPSADVGSRTFLVKLDLPETAKIRAGQFARASLERGKATTIAIPAGALVNRGQMELVWLAVDGKAVLRLVRSGRKWEGTVEILAGLEGGELVVVGAPSNLREGTGLVEKVPVVKP